MTAPATRRDVDEGAGHAPAVAGPGTWGRHPAIRMPVLIVGALITVAVLAVSTVVAANVMVRTSETADQTFAGAIHRVEVRVDGMVTITVGVDDRATLHRRSSFGARRPTVRTSLTDGTLKVRVLCPSGVVVGCSNQVRLEVPAGVAVTARAIEARISDVTGAVEVDTTAGVVELDRLHGRLDISVGGGSVVGRDLHSAEADVRAGAGSIQLGFASAPRWVDARSGAGSTIVDLPPGEESYRVDAQAGAGDRVVQVREDPASDRLIRAKSGAGAVEVRYRP